MRTTRALVLAVTLAVLGAGACQPAPETFIDSGPGPSTERTTETFTFHSDDPKATFECSVDGSAFARCSGPSASHTTPVLSAPSVHQFRVRALNAGQVDPTPAATFTWVDPRPFQGTSSIVARPNSLASDPTRARAHPNVVHRFEVQGAHEVQSLVVTLPKGLLASLAGVAEPWCTRADASSGNCPASAEIGALRVEAILQGTSGGAVNLDGPVYVVEPAAGSAEIAGVAFEIAAERSGSTAVGLGSLKILGGGNNVELSWQDVARQVAGQGLHINAMELTLRGDTGGASHPLIINPSACPTPPAQQKSEIAVYPRSDGTRPAPVISSSDYSVSGCASLAFQPAFQATLSDPIAGNVTGVVARVDLPADNSAIQRFSFRLPPFIGANAPAIGSLADMCPGTALNPARSEFVNPAQCPAQARVGTVTLETPMLPRPLTGGIFIVNLGIFPGFGVQLNRYVNSDGTTVPAQGVDIRLVGRTTLVDILGCTGCGQQFQVIIGPLPDVPITNVNIDLNGPPRPRPAGQAPLPGKLLYMADSGDSACLAEPVTVGEFLLYSRPTERVVLKQPMPIYDCGMRITSPEPHALLASKDFSVSFSVADFGGLLGVACELYQQGPGGNAILLETDAQCVSPKAYRVAESGAYSVKVSASYPDRSAPLESKVDFGVSSP